MRDCGEDGSGAGVGGGKMMDLSQPRCEIDGSGLDTLLHDLCSRFEDR